MLFLVFFLRLGVFYVVVGNDALTIYKSIAARGCVVLVVSTLTGLLLWNLSRKLELLYCSFSCKLCLTSIA